MSSPRSNLYLSSEDILNNANYVTNDRTFTDPRGNGIYVKEDGTETVVSFVVTYGMNWDSKNNKWMPLFHTGLLFSGSFQSIKDGVDFKYCLLHGVPSKEGTKLELHFGNSELELNRILARFVGSAGWEDYTKAFGKTKICLSRLAQMAVSVLEHEFVLSGLRTRIRNGDVEILPEGNTNCIDVCCKMLETMGFDASFNDLLVRILVKCYTRVAGNNLKYVCDDDMRDILIEDIRGLVKYKHGISRGTMLEQIKLHGFLCNFL